MGGLGGKGKGQRRRDGDSKQDRVFDRKSGEFKSNTSARMITKKICQKEENEFIPRKLRGMLKRMGKDPDEAAASMSMCTIPAGRIRNKYKHKDEQRRGHISSLWAPVGLLVGKPEPAEVQETVLKSCNSKNMESSFDTVSESNDGGKGGRLMYEREGSCSTAGRTRTLDSQHNTSEDLGQSAKLGKNIEGKDTAKPAISNKKLRLLRLHERKKKKKGSHAQEDLDLDPRETRQDVVGFGEVAMMPPTLTLKRKRGQNSSGGEMLQPESKGQKLGALMAKQMAGVGGTAAPTARAAGASGVSAHERLRLEIIAQYRNKRHTLARLPNV